jgi:hypothetical protein
MNDAQQVAYIQAQAVCAQAEIEGMKATNQIRISLGQSLAYDEDAFFNVPARYGITHNQVMELFLNIPRSS